MKLSFFKGVSSPTFGYFFFCPTGMPHHCPVPLCTNRSGKSCKKGFRFLEDGSFESYRLCGSELVRVGCGGNAAVCSSLSLYSYPNPNVKDAGLSKRNKALLRQWQVKVRKENLVLSEKNDACVCGAHFLGLCRASVTDVPSVFAWSKQMNQRRTLVKHPLPSARLNTKDLDREAASAAVDDEDRGDPADPADPTDPADHDPADPVDPVVSVDVPSRGDSACADGVELDSAVVSAADLVDSADTASANDGTEGCAQQEDIAADSVTDADDCTGASASVSLDNSYPEENVWQEYRRCQAENEALRDELVFLKAKLAEAVDRQEELEGRLEKSRFTMKNFQHSDNLVRFYTGLPTADYFQAYFQLASSCLVKLHAGCPHCLSDEDEFFIMLVKLRRNFPEEELAVRTGVSQSTISRAFRKWVTALATALRSLPIWPSREQVIFSMPANVQSMYPNARVIIDGVELFIEKSANPTAQSTTWSSYKHHNTAKALAGVTQSGSVSFVSKLYGGRTGAYTGGGGGGSHRCQ